MGAFSLNEDIPMFGVEVLTWTSSLSGVSSPWQVLKNYLFKGSPGHSALKITIPDTFENRSLIKAYCQNENGEAIIPYYEEEVIVTCQEVIDSEKGIIKYYPKIEKGWVVYFSWWPTGLRHEHDDRTIENRALEVSYTQKWKTYFEVKEKPVNQGLIGDWLGDSLCDWLWPDKVDVPINEIFHLKSQGKKQYFAYKKAQADFESAASDLSKIKQDIRILTEDSFDRLIKFEREESSLALRAYFFPQCLIDESKNYIHNQQKVFLQNTALLEKLSEEKKRLSLVYDECKANLDKYSRQSDKNPLSLGINPTYTFRLPIEGTQATINGLNIEDMLKQMKTFVQQKEDFHILYNNCSSTVQEIIFAGITRKLWASLREEGQLSSSATLPGVVETPDRLAGLMNEFEKAFATIRMARINKRLAESATEPKVEIVQRQKPIINRRISSRVSHVPQSKPGNSKRALL